MRQFPRKSLLAALLLSIGLAPSLAPSAPDELASAIAGHLVDRDAGNPDALDLDGDGEITLNDLVLASGGGQGVFGPLPPGPPPLRIFTLESTSGEPGETVIVKFSGQNMVEVAAANLSIDYDSDLVNPGTVEVGPALSGFWIVEQNVLELGPLGGMKQLRIVFYHDPTMETDLEGVLLHIPFTISPLLTEDSCAALALHELAVSNMAGENIQPDYTYQSGFLCSGPPPQTLAVSPGEALLFEHESRPFAALVNGVENRSISWRIVDALDDGVDADIYGALSDTEANPVILTAPENAPDYDNRARLIATSAENPSLEAEALIWVLGVQSSSEGDITGDGIVDSGDTRMAADILLHGLAATGEIFLRSDVNADGTIDSGDIVSTVNAAQQPNAP